MDRWLGDGGMALIGTVGASFDDYGVDGEDLGWVGGTFTPAAAACNPHGIVQAGVHGLLLDAAMNFAINAALPGRARTRATLEMKIETMRPAVLGGVLPAAGRGGAPGPPGGLRRGHGHRRRRAAGQPVDRHLPAAPARGAGADRPDRLAGPAARPGRARRSRHRPPPRPSDRGAPCDPARRPADAATAGAPTVRPAAAPAAVCGRVRPPGRPRCASAAGRSPPSSACRWSRWWRCASTGWGTGSTAGCVAYKDAAGGRGRASASRRSWSTELTRGCDRRPGRRPGGPAGPWAVVTDGPVVAPAGRRRRRGAWSTGCPALAGATSGSWSGDGAPAGTCGPAGTCSPRPPGVDRAGLAGLPVLVFDDTTTTGAAVQSAAAALRLAGARVVGALVMGRALAPPGPCRGRRGRPTVRGAPAADR